MNKMDRKTMNTQRVFKESFKKPLKEGMMNSKLIKEDSESRVEKCKKAIEMLKSIDVDVFYEALAIYDMCGVDVPTEEQFEKVSNIVSDVDTIYDEYIRSEVRDVCGDNVNEIEEESLQEDKERGRMKFKKNRISSQE